MMMWILAQTARMERLKAMRQGITESESSGSWMTLLGAVALLASIAGVLVLLNRILSYRRSSGHTPKRLFHQLTRQANLPTEDIRVLKKMAAKLDLAHPTQMLLSPQLLAQAVAQMTAIQPLSTTEIERCHDVSQRLFDSPLPELTPDALSHSMG